MLFLYFLAGLSILGNAQQPATAAGSTRQVDTTLSHRITQKMTDSLQLSLLQRRQIHTANCWVDSSKVAVIGQFHGTDSLNIGMDKIERCRDSLYQRILTDKQFVQYGLHKGIWVLNN
jgi:hypothetical protein